MVKTSFNDFVMQNKSFTVHKEALFISKHPSRHILVTVILSSQDTTTVQVQLPEQRKVSWVCVSTDFAD
jgi:hypothetical protein